MKVIWTKRAQYKLREINNYISKDSIVNARKQVEQVITQVDRLVNFPNMGRESLQKGVREILSGNYRISYTVSDKQLRILNITHVRQNNRS